MGRHSSNAKAPRAEPKKPTRRDRIKLRLALLGCAVMAVGGFAMSMEMIADNTLCSGTSMSAMDHCLHYSKSVERYIPASSSEDTSKAHTYLQQISYNRGMSKLLLAFSVLFALVSTFLSYQEFSDWLVRRRQTTI